MESERRCLHFILINEKKDTNKYSKFLFYALQLKLETSKIMIYECKPEKKFGMKDLYNSWFIDMMLRKDDNNVIIVKHQEDDGINLCNFLDKRIHAFSIVYKHFVTNINLNTEHNLGDESYFVLMAYQMIPSIWGDFTDMKYGTLECQRFLDLEHRPDNPGMNFDV